VQTPLHEFCPASLCGRVGTRGVETFFDIISLVGSLICSVWFAGSAVCISLRIVGAGGYWIAVVFQIRFGGGASLAMSFGACFTWSGACADVPRGGKMK